MSLSSLRSGTIRPLLGPADLVSENVSWGWTWGGKLVYCSPLDVLTFDLLPWGSKTGSLFPPGSFAVCGGLSLVSENIKN